MGCTSVAIAVHYSKERVFHMKNCFKNNLELPFGLVIDLSVMYVQVTFFKGCCHWIPCIA